MEGDGDKLYGSFVFEDGSKYEGEYNESDGKKSKDGKVKKLFKDVIGPQNLPHISRHVFRDCIKMDQSDTKVIGVMIG
jgi:hypothetical protein